MPTTLEGSPYADPPRPEGDRRRHDIDPAMTPRRRIYDSLFNRIRWPAFVYSWFVLGFVLLLYLIYRFQVET